MSVRRWVWTGSQFDEMPPVAVTRIVMPDVVGLTVAQASGELARLGIVSYNLNAPDYGEHSGEQSKVTAQSPVAGAVLHPPNFVVTLTTR